MAIVKGLDYNTAVRLLLCIAEMEIDQEEGRKCVKWHIIGRPDHPSQIIVSKLLLAGRRAVVSQSLN